MARKILESFPRVRQNCARQKGADEIAFQWARNAVKFCPLLKETYPQEIIMARRAFLTRMAQLAALPFLTVAGSLQAQAGHKQLKILMKSAWGSDDPTKAAFPFSHGLALADAGHEVQIYLLGEAVVLMRKVVADSVTPVGWPPVGDFLNKLAAKHVQIYACGACSKARGVTESDLANYGAKFGNPPIFVSLIEWADHIITE
jgi:predicted peroxiredoxin